MTPELTPGILRLLSASLPGDLAEALVGDLAEEASQHSLGWLARQACGAIWYVHVARWRDALRGAALVSGLAAAGVVAAAAMALWGLVLGAVPRRAAHPMGFGWMLSILVAAIVAAAVVSAIVRAETTSTNDGTMRPE